MTPRHFMPCAVLIAVLSGLAVAPVAAQPASAVPESWKRYAETLVYEVGDLIERSDAPAAVRLREALTASSNPPRVARIWADPAGVIVRVDGGKSAPPAFEQDLRALLMNHILGEAPPRTLAWPISIGLSGVTRAPSQEAAPPPAR